MTLDLLWQEYKEQHPEGYQYSQFCDLYRRYRAKLDYCMRQDHRGGEKLFVDYGEGALDALKSISRNSQGSPAPTIFPPTGPPPEQRAKAALKAVGK